MRAHQEMEIYFMFWRILIKWDWYALCFGYDYICFDDMNHQNLTNVILNRKMIDNNLIGIWEIELYILIEIELTT